MSTTNTRKNLTFSAKTESVMSTQIEVLEGELGVIQIYFRKILLHQQKFLVVSILSNAPWLQRY